MFFAGLILVALMFGALFLAGAIYDTGKKATVETYFFQPNNLYQHRQETPRAAHDLSSDELRDMLLNKYITEYFYVTPDKEELALRIGGQTSLRKMSTANVFEEWATNIAPEIEEMANANILRMASLVSVTPEPGSDKYWRVEYELKTWTRPNDLSAKPQITRGTMFMDILFLPEMRKSMNNGKLSIEKYLESGKDPVAVFSFRIRDITTQAEE